jgi:hypothetical protein
LGCSQASIACSYPCALAYDGYNEGARCVGGTWSIARQSNTCAPSTTHTTVCP